VPAENSLLPAFVDAVVHSRTLASDDECGKGIRRGRSVAKALERRRLPVGLHFGLGATRLFVQVILGAFCAKEYGVALLQNDSIRLWRIKQNQLCQVFRCKASCGKPATLILGSSEIGRTYLSSFDVFRMFRPISFSKRYNF